MITHSEKKIYETCATEKPWHKKRSHLGLRSGSWCLVYF